MFIYYPRCDDSIIRHGGLPEFLLVQDIKVEYVCGEKAIEILAQLKFRDHVKDRCIYREYERKVFNCDFVDEKESSYISEIIHVCNEFSYGVLVC